MPMAPNNVFPKLMTEDDAPASPSCWLSRMLVASGRL